MAEVFFGAWHIVLIQVVDPMGSRFRISGSANADGAYETHDDQPLEVAVDGPEWTLTMETWIPVEWTPGEIRRRNRFDRMIGLVADLETGRPPGGGIGPVYQYLHLRCTSRDPAVNPDPVPNPYDFTVPERHLHPRAHARA